MATNHKEINNFNGTRNIQDDSWWNMFRELCCVTLYFCYCCFDFLCVYSW